MVRELGQFREQVRAHRRDVGRKQEELARAIGLHPNVLSHKLNGHTGASLTTADVIRIVTTLASWGALTTREEARAMFGLMAVPANAVPPSLWATSALADLEGQDRAISLTRGTERPHTAAAVPRRAPLRPVSLPAPMTPLVGRANECAVVHDALSASRLVTLTGVGGTGKTRLALQVAAEAAGDFADGVAFLDLVPVHDPALLPGALVRALGLTDQFSVSVEEHLTEALRPAHVLLVVDNVEHLVEEAPLLGRLLSAAPALRILATSRIQLHLYGEHEVRVPPLELPDTDTAAPDEVARSESVQLFIQRARASRPDFSPSGETVSAIGAICTALDGLPLAIELAAARIKLFAPEALLSQLPERFDLLTGGPRDHPPRQQTFRAALDWSYALLTPEMRQLLARLGVFAGTIEAAAAAAVCGEDGDAMHMLQRLTDLRDQSLLELVGSPTPRFRLLQTIREYALARLAESEEAERISAAYARYFLLLAEESEGEFRGPEQAVWSTRLDAELDNLRAGLAWFLEQGQVEDALRLATALHPFWYEGGYWQEARRWLEEGVACGARVAPAVHVRAIQSLGSFLSERGEVEKATPLLQEALALSRQLNHPRGCIRALNALGGVAMRQGCYDVALSRFEEALLLCTAPEQRTWTGVLLKNAGNAARHAGDLAIARQRYEEVLARHHEEDNAEVRAVTLVDLGAIALADGDLEEAEARLTESLAVSRAGRIKPWAAYALGGLGELARRRSHLDLACRHQHEAMTLARSVGDVFLVLHLLGDTAMLMCTLGRLESAARLKGAEMAQRDALQLPVPSVHVTEGEETLAHARDGSSEGAFNRAWLEGQAMSLDQAITYALCETED